MNEKLVTAIIAAVTAIAVFLLMIGIEQELIALKGQKAKKLLENMRNVLSKQ